MQSNPAVAGHPHEPSASPSTARPLAASLGAVVAGLVAMSCCVAPLILVLAGISGAWIANLTALSPYQPVFVGVAIAAIVYGHVTARRARRACGAGAVCARPLPRWSVEGGLWAGTVLVGLALAANLVAPYLL